VGWIGGFFEKGFVSQGSLLNIAIDLAKLRASNYGKTESFIVGFREIGGWV
jgi:hypothetical protein